MGMTSWPLALGHIRDLTPLAMPLPMLLAMRSQYLKKDTKMLPLLAHSAGMLLVNKCGMAQLVEVRHPLMKAGVPDEVRWSLMKAGIPEYALGAKHLSLA